MALARDKAHDSMKIYDARKAYLAIVQIAKPREL
jgi:hypothetical protein